MATSPSPPSPCGVVVVVWKDIVSRSDWVGEKEEVVRVEKPIDCVSVGWILRDDAEMIVVADSYTKDKNYGGTTAIPRGVIVEVYEVDKTTPVAFLKRAQLTQARQKKKK